MILWFVKRNWKTFYVKSNFDGYAGQYVSLGRPYSHCSVNASSSRHVTRTKKVVRCVTGAWQPCVTNELVKVTWITKDSFLSPWHLFFFNISLYNSLLQVSPSRLTFEDFQQLLSVVGVKSLREEDPQLISLLSMRATWFLSLFPWVSVIIFLPVFDFGWYVVELGNETVWRLGHLKTW